MAAIERLIEYHRVSEVSGSEFGQAQSCIAPFYTKSVPVFFRFYTVVFMRFGVVFCTHLLAALAVAVLCSGCTSSEGLLGGYMEVPEQSREIVVSSLEVTKPGCFYQVSGVVYSFAPSGTWNEVPTWNARCYDQSFRLLDSATFQVNDNEQPVNFFRCGNRLLLLTEDREGDSLNLVGRWFDASAKPQSDRIVLIRRLLEDETEQQEKSPYTAFPSPDSTHFLVRNTAYREDEVREDTVIFETSVWAFNDRLELMQHQVVASYDKTVPKTTQVDNSGHLYIVKESSNNELFVHRYGRNDSASIPVPIPAFDTLQANVGSAFLLPENEDGGYLFSVVRVGKSVNMKELHIHFCNWKTGTATTVVNYGTGRDVAEKVAGDVSMGDFQLQRVFPTSQGFVVWTELLADTIVRSSHKHGKWEVYDVFTHMLYGGTTALFAFTKQGRLLWQKGFVQKEIFSNMEGKKPYSYIATVHDTVCLLKQNNDVEHRRESPFSFRCNFKFYTISLATGEAAGPVTLLNSYRTARIANDVILGLDRRNILVPCYEPDRAGTRLLHFRL